MALSVPHIYEAFHTLLTTFPSAVDVNRDQAGTDLAAKSFGVYISSRPQGSGNLAVTLERAGGPAIANIDTPDSRVSCIMDVTCWSKGDGTRSGVESWLELQELIRVYLVGLSGTVAGVQIENIEVESEPFAADIPPTDASDGWISQETMAYLVYYRRVTSSKRTAELAGTAPWLLAGGVWNDAGQWDDSAVWED